MSEIAGRVLKSTGSWYTVQPGSGPVVMCRLPGRFRMDVKEETNPIAVGDRVDFVVQEDGSGQIVTIGERRNTVVRQATHGRRGSQVLAANVDLAVCVVSVAKPVYKTGFVDRFLVTCDANQVPPLIFVNKYDLARPEDRERLEELTELYAGLGYDWMVGSALDPTTLAALNQRIGDGIVMFMGPSGTGKSSLLNALAPGLRRETAEVSRFSNKGMHTTTYAELLPLPNGGYVADTPGIREFGLVDIDAPGLSNFFPEMRHLREKCRYYNCTHVHEPDCAVMAAYEAGEVHPERYMNYLQILESVR